MLCKRSREPSQTATTSALCLHRVSFPSLIYLQYLLHQKLLSEIWRVKIINSNFDTGEEGRKYKFETAILILFLWGISRYVSCWAVIEKPPKLDRKARAQPLDGAGGSHHWWVVQGYCRCTYVSFQHHRYDTIDPMRHLHARGATIASSHWSQTLTQNTYNIIFVYCHP